MSHIQSHSSGALWFYAGDIPYMYFRVGAASFFINFEVLTYHKPLDEILLTDEGKALDPDDEKEFAYYGPRLKHERKCVFRIGGKPDCELAITSHINDYLVEYGSEGNSVARILIEPDKIEQVVKTFDEMIEKGKSDAYGDFKQEDSRLVSAGIASILHCMASTWTYKRTAHENEPGCWNETVPVPVVLSEPITVVVDPNSTSYAPWKRMPSP